MKEVILQNLKEGMIIAKDVMTKGGQRILEKGRVLNKQSILRLSFYNTKSVMVEDPTPEAPEVSKTPEAPDAPVKRPAPASIAKPTTPVASAPKAYSQTIKTSQKFQSFQIDHTIVLNTIKTSLENYVNNGVAPDTDVLLSSVLGIFNSCKTSLELFNMLHNMHSSKDSIYSHSLNVALICRQLGKWLKFDAQTLDTLTLAGVLHDIGKLKIPTELLDKPGKYTEEEFKLVKMHTQYGFDLLKTLPLDERIKKAALSHHERCDGTGYPMRLTQDDTDDFAMIVAIADVYDAMTTARSYRAPLCPFQVIDNFEKDGLQKYKPQYILTFLGHIAGTYQNHRILLNDGRSANIVMLNKQYLSRPIVQLDDNSCIDLSTTPDLFIKAVV